MSFDLKDLFQFGVPTVLLVALIKGGIPLLRDAAQAFLSAIKEGFARLDKTLQDQHAENRQDREEDRRLRAETNSAFSQALSLFEERRH